LEAADNIEIEKMKESDDNPLGLENRQYSVEEFGQEVRNKVGGDKYVSNLILGEMFLAAYPVYRCKIIQAGNGKNQNGCSCC
tara:strand:+ start:2402 stop:2647 length:246 start_codon:yes stop_codon:yes gene_type:complete